MNRPTIIGDSRALQQVCMEIKQVAASDGAVVIEGETGVGKELVARDIHARSARRHGPFVAVNCAAIVETLFEAELFGIEDGVATGVRSRVGKIAKADRGTLFLDEIGDLSAAGQAKLLRVLQEFAVVRVGSAIAQTVDVRIIVATNRPLRSLVDRGCFRADLFYRLQGLEIVVPPLRERREDIVPLAEHFAAQIRKAPAAVSVAAGQALQIHPWPGNVRELRRAIEHALVFGAGDRVEVPDLPAHVRGTFEQVLAPALERGNTLREWAASYTALTLEKCGGNKRRTCRVLGISYHTLQKHLDRARFVQV